ncbi:hypothetical protein [Candidatus Leptofilum sp.]|uniref:hypothetical protein n=1 Tax=Candidatus Leptofilum sp. TaxID=3241576 RepID=UPI003B5BAD75
MNSERQFEEENWILHISYANAGTRSEGQHGDLRHNGRSLQPTHEGQELDTPLGRLKYYLYPDKADFPFAITGWNYANNKLIRPSTFTPPPELMSVEQEALVQIVRSFRNFNELFYAIDRGFEKEGKADLQREKGRIIEATAVLREEIKARLPLLTAAIAAQKDLSNRHHHYLNELTYQFPFLEQKSI